MKEIRERLEEENEEKISYLREKFIKEKDDALEKERVKSQDKMHAQFERLESQFNEERKRWKDSMLSECERVDTLRKREADNYLKTMDEVKTSHDKEIK
jgi:hypothetical protein